jgi:hypothetical protein
MQLFRQNMVERRSQSACTIRFQPSVANISVHFDNYFRLLSGAGCKVHRLRGERYICESLGCRNRQMTRWATLKALEDNPRLFAGKDRICLWWPYIPDRAGNESPQSSFHWPLMANRYCCCTQAQVRRWPYFQSTVR